MKSILFKVIFFFTILHIFQEKHVSASAPVDETTTLFSVTTTQTFIDISNDTSVVRCSSNYQGASLSWIYIPSVWEVNITEHDNYIELHVIDAKNVTSRNSIQCVGTYYNISTILYAVANVTIVSGVKFETFELDATRNTTYLPFKSRVNVFCHNVANKYKAIISVSMYMPGATSITAFVAYNFTVQEKYKDHYEISYNEDTNTIIFTVKYLTTNVEIMCTNKVKSYIYIDGYNSIQENTKLVTYDQDGCIYHPFGSELDFYLYYNHDIRSIVITDQDKTKFDIVVYKSEFNTQFEDEFDYNTEKNIISTNVLTIKNMTQQLNGSQIHAFSSGINTNNYRFTVIGFEYKPIADPICTTESSTTTRTFLCTVKKSNPPAVVTYKQNSDMSHNEVIMSDSGDENVFRLSLNSNNNDVVSCNVIQKFPGEYHDVVKSCNFEQI